MSLWPRRDSGSRLLSGLVQSQTYPELSDSGCANAYQNDKDRAMKILLEQNAKIIGQGITGSEGSTAVEWMLKYGTNVVGGVTPGKGGQEVCGIPIFNTVAEAQQAVGPVDGTVLYVPPILVKRAVTEAIEAGIKWILIVSERVPTRDAAEMYTLAQKEDVCIIGPASAGIINPSLQIKIGSIGGPAPTRAYIPGPVAVISKSGSMTSEISLHLKNNGLGVSWAVTIGGERIIGTDFGDFLIAVEQDSDTKASVIFGELGGTYEERVAALVKEGKITKPVVAFLGGEFTMSLPSEVQFGHAGAIIEGSRGKPEHKRKVLQEAGVKVAEEFDQIAELVKDSLR
jgi:succinyl-CoA synthetase alpha subunit